jgi:arylsulfatase A-like enzyme/Tfp pilus assembly protein PilF
MDALAERGVTFLDATAHAPLTLPSHASLMTGQFPSRHAVRDNSGFPLGPSFETLAELLGKADYQTAAFVSSYVLNRKTGISQGFETFVDRFATGAVQLTPASLERPGPELAAEAAEWLESTSQPFFLWVHFYDPHAPYEAPAAFADEWPGRSYEAEVATSDWALGQLLHALPEDMKDRTVVVVTADHGESLGEHGEPEHGIFLYDATLKVPLIMAGPGLPEGVTIQDQVRHVDVIPTVLDLLRMAPPADMDGETLLPLVAGGKRARIPVSYAESAFGHLHFGCSDLRAVRTGDWKYIEAPKAELYNLGDDPGEKQNLYAHESEVVRGLIREFRSIPQAKVATQTETVDAATAERLRALGYLGGTGQTPGGQTGEDPKDRIGDYVAYISKFNDAARVLEAGDRKRAADGFRKLTQQFPASFEAHQYLGRALAAQGLHVAALEAYDEALRLSPHSAVLYLDAALSLAAEREFDRAFDYVERSLRAEPESFYGYLVEGLVAREAGLDREARGAFEKALAINSELAMAEYQLGVMALDRGKKEEAASRFRKAVRIDPLFHEARKALNPLEGLP